jgi:hypothetical protein
VFTGYDWDYFANGGFFTDVAWHDYDVPSTHFAANPMWFNPDNHSNLEVTFLGTTIPANTPGREALRIALDRLFNHPNTGPFFARQMIQRLVTSNPSPAYVGRVAAAFANNGSGTRGDLRAVWTAIFMDEEARAAPSAANTTSGKLREPVVRFVQMLRTVGITSSNGKYEIYDTSPADQGAGAVPAALAVGVQLFPAGLRATWHRDGDRRQAGAGVPAAQRDHHRRLHQLGAMDQSLAVQRCWPQLLGAADNCPRHGLGARLARPASSRPTSCRTILQPDSRHHGRLCHHGREHAGTEAQHAGDRDLPHHDLARILVQK